MVAANPQASPTYFSALKAITGGEILAYTVDKPIGKLLLDSRQLTIAPDSIFFAIKGNNHDGHQFIPSVYAQGVRQFVVEYGNQNTYKDLASTNIIKVANSIKALQSLAAYHRTKYQLPILAITGSNGKTMVKEWLGQLLSLKYPIIKSPKSYNSQIGVPLSVWMLDQTHAYGIFEAGVSLPGEMARLAPIIQPTLGLLTNIGTAHDQGFATKQQKLQEKLQLFAHCTKIYYCADHTEVSQALTERYQDTHQLISWSLNNKKADFQIQKWTRNNQSTQTLLQVTSRQLQHTFTVPFQDAVSLENVSHCIVFLLNEGFHPCILQAALATLRSIPMRMTLKPGMNNCQVVDDTYNNDLVGLKVALDFMAQQKYTTKRTVILSDVLQAGIPAKKLYQQIATLLKEKGITRVIGIGTAISTHAAAFAGLDTYFHSHTEAFMQGDRHHNFRNELILVKGARTFGFERIVAQLQQKIHSTVLEIDLDAIAHNLNFFRSKLTEKTKIMVMVKALAYGSSSFEIAHLLQHQRVDYLAVAYTDEGVMLRNNGIRCPIMVMNPTPESFDKLIDYQLEPEIYSLRLLKAFITFLARRKKTIPVHLKLETGMYRLGLEASALPTMVQHLQKAPMIKVASLFSHLAASDAPQHDAYTQQQVATFLKLAQCIENKLAIKPIKHVLNTSGILRFPQYQLDMVRLGIGLYGVGVSEAAQQQLAIASTLKTVISQLKTVPQGHTVGYGRQGIATSPMKIATIAIGYADGFSRALGNGIGKVWINGHYAPVVGNVCMDMSMVDVTHIPAVAEGDEVIIFGKALPIAVLAASIGTIPYEILTNVSERVKRIYYTN